MVERVPVDEESRGKNASAKKARRIRKKKAELQRNTIESGLGVTINEMD